MLEALIDVYDSWRYYSGVGIQLEPNELPPEFFDANTQFAMYCKTNWAGDACLVLFSNGEVGLEGRIGDSLWYMIEDSGIKNSHMLELEISYRHTQDGWEAG